MYWVGPILGSVVAVLLYQYVFAGDASPRKAKTAFSWSNEQDIEPCDDDVIAKSPDSHECHCLKNVNGSAELAV